MVYFNNNQNCYFKILASSSSLTFFQANGHVDAFLQIAA